MDQSIRSHAGSQIQPLLNSFRLQLVAELWRTCCDYDLPSVRQGKCLLLGSDVFKLMQALALAIVTGPFRSLMHPLLAM